MAGSQHRPIAIVGEAWGTEERRRATPFVGYTGRLLHSVMSRVGIDAGDALMTNVFNLQPQPTNDIVNLCGRKDEGIPWRIAIAPGRYIHKRYAPELERLTAELTACSPNLIVALGNTALWALTNTKGITTARGTVRLCPLAGREVKLLPTFHPSAVARQPSLMPTLYADLGKARREMETPEYTRPNRAITIPEAVWEIAQWVPRLRAAPKVAVDIETIGAAERTAISCIGFAPSQNEALVVPFYNPTKGGPYWERLEDEIEAWRLVAHICKHVRAVGQNFNFDMHHLWRSYGIVVPNACDDTMLAHHALQPELKKGLGFLASMYTNEAHWKTMRTLKKED